MSKPQETWEIQLQRITGQAVKALREERGDSVDSVARQLGDTGDSLRKKEAGKRRFSVAEIVRLADLWSVTTDRLIFGVGPRPRFMPVVRLALLQGNSPLSETPRPAKGRPRH